MTNISRYAMLGVLAGSVVGLSAPAFASEAADDALNIGLVLIGIVLGAGLAMVLGRMRPGSRVDPQRPWRALGGLREGVIATDPQGKIVFINQAAAELTGWPATEATGQALHRVYHIIDEHSRTDINCLLADERKSAAPSEAGGSTVRLVRKDGQEVSVHGAFTTVHAEGADPGGYAVVFHDVSRMLVLAQQLSWQADHDALTGLVNRKTLESRLAELVESARSHGRQHVLLYIDIDRFKTINDSCGRAAGDELLHSLASLMSGKLRGSDTLARMSGDEFAALLPLCPLDQGLRVANAIREAVRAFSFVWDGKSFTVATSIGLVPLDAGSADVDTVLRAAETCCIEAKNKGRDHVQVHRTRAGMTQPGAEPQMITRLGHAFEHGEFVLYQQYIRPLKGAVSSPHFEILVRIRGEASELIPPMAFLPAAERYNLLTAIDRLVIVDLLKVLSARQRTQSAPMGPEAGMYSLNLSGASINDSSFPEFLRAQLLHFPVAPSLLCFEITETTAISNLTKAAELMHELKALGCRFALDDFGIGMSSFAYLKYLPVDFLKIDGTFVKDMATDEMDYAIVEAINRIAHILGMQTVAEIVEDQVTLDRLSALGVDYAQGYHIARPEPLRAEVAIGTAGVVG
jgi:diguanylate cyclase (GGDEF)-like protein/PAS domain S-box-containing protein